MRRRRYKELNVLRVGNQFFNGVLAMYDRPDLDVKQSYFLQEVVVHFLLRYYREIVLTKLCKDPPLTIPDLASEFRSDVYTLTVPYLRYITRQWSDVADVNVTKGNKAALIKQGNPRLFFE
jgi:hypothetical protein